MWMRRTACLWVCVIGTALPCSALAQQDLPLPSGVPQPEPVPMPMLRGAAIEQSPASLAATNGAVNQFVMLDVRLIEVSRPLSPDPLGTRATNESAPAEPATNRRSTVDGLPKFDSQAQILTPDELAQFLAKCQADGQFKTVSAPKLQLKLGERGTFRSGGELYLSGDASAANSQDSDSSPKIEPVFVGTTVDATVTSSSKGLLRVAIMVEHAEMTALNSSSNGLPGIAKRRVSTQADLQDGQTLRLCGLLSHRKTASTARVPILGELPVVGDKLFSKTKYADEQAELVLLVTPVLVDKGVE